MLLLVALPESGRKPTMEYIAFYLLFLYISTLRKDFKGKKIILAQKKRRKKKFVFCKHLAPPPVLTLRTHALQHDISSSHFYATLLNELNYNEDFHCNVWISHRSYCDEHFFVRGHSNYLCCVQCHYLCLASRE